jgi:hypothetical protein
MKLNQTPDWRWLRARRLADNGLTPRRSRDDHHVCLAWKFLKRLRKLDIKAEERLACDFPTLFDAFKIYDDPQSGVRWIFEAGVMARRSVDMMSEYLRTDAETLQLYEEIFFDVRDALDNQGCIMSNILMPIVTHSVSARDPDVFLKGIAYFGGWEAVRSSWELGHASPEAIDFFNRAIRQKIMKNAYDALHTAQINSFNAKDHIQAMLEQKRQDFETNTPATGDVVHAQLGSLLSAIQISMIPARAELSQEEPRLQSPQLPHRIKNVEAEPADTGKDKSDG